LKAKKNEHIAELDIVDGQNKFETTVTKVGSNPSDECWVFKSIEE
jgi:hypothetical protein